MLKLSNYIDFVLGVAWGALTLPAMGSIWLFWSKIFRRGKSAAKLALVFVMWLICIFAYVALFCSVGYSLSLHFPEDPPPNRAMTVGVFAGLLIYVLRVRLTIKKFQNE